MNRKKSFDKIQNYTLEVLENPEVVASLGDKAITYSQMLEKAYLPDIEDQALRLPASQLFEDNIAVVPLKKGEKHIPDVNYLLQWPRFSDFEASTLDTSRDYLGFYRQLQLLEQRNRAVFKNAIAMTMIDYTEIRNKDDTDQTYPFVTRPIVFVNSNSTKQPKELLAADVAHELCHVDNLLKDYQEKADYDSYSDVFPEKVVSLAIQEKKAYGVGYQILKACGIDSVEVAKDDLKDIFRFYGSYFVMEGIDMFRRYVKKDIDTQDRLQCRKPIFKTIPPEAVSVAINETFGENDKQITDEEIIAYASVGIVQRKRKKLHKYNLQQ